MQIGTTHILKTVEPYFSDIKKQLKTFDVRKNDRNFKINDTIKFCQFIDEKLTGEEIQRYITYIMDDPLYCKSNTVILGISTSPIRNYWYENCLWNIDECAQKGKIKGKDCCRECEQYVKDNLDDYEN